MPGFEDMLRLQELNELIGQKRARDQASDLATSVGEAVLEEPREGPQPQGLANFVGGVADVVTGKTAPERREAARQAEIAKITSRTQEPQAIQAQSRPVAQAQPDQQFITEELPGGTARPPGDFSEFIEPQPQAQPAAQAPSQAENLALIDEGLLGVSEGAQSALAQEVRQEQATQARRADATQFAQAMIAAGATPGQVATATKAYNDAATSLDQILAAEANAIGLNAQAELTEAGLTAASQEEQAGLREELASDIQDIRAQTLDSFKQNQEQLAQVTAQLANGQINPGRAFADTSILGKLGIAFTAGLGGILQAQGVGGGNPVLATINKIIDRDVQAQVKDQDSLLQRSRQLGASNAQLLSMAGAQSKAMAIQKIAAAEGMLKSKIAETVLPQKSAAKAQKLLADLESRRAQLEGEFNKLSLDVANQSAKQEFAARVKLAGKARRSGGGSGSGSSVSKEAGTLTNPESDTFGVIPNVAKRLKARGLASGDIGKFSGRVTARLQATQLLNEYANKVKRFNLLAKKNRFGSSELTELRALQGEILNVGRLKTNSGANFTDSEMELLRSQFAIHEQGLFSGAVVEPQNFKDIIRRLRNEQLLDYEGTAGVRGDELNRLRGQIEKRMRFRRPGRGVQTKAGQRISNLIKATRAAKTPEKQLEALNGWFDQAARSQDKSARKMAEDLAKKILKSKEATPEQKESAQAVVSDLGKAFGKEKDARSRKQKALDAAGLFATGLNMKNLRKQLKK